MNYSVPFAVIRGEGSTGPPVLWGGGGGIYIECEDRERRGRTHIVELSVCKASELRRHIRECMEDTHVNEDQYKKGQQQSIDVAL